MQLNSAAVVGPFLFTPTVYKKYGITVQQTAMIRIYMIDSESAEIVLTTLLTLTVKIDPKPANRVEYAVTVISLYFFSINDAVMLYEA